MHASRHLSIICLLVSAVSARRASAAEPGTLAEDLFEVGVKYMEQQRYEKGCPAIEGSFNLDPLPGTLFTLAECEAKRGRLATALARYHDYLALFATLTPEKKARQGERPEEARAQQTSLELAVPKLSIVLSENAPPGAVVKRDGIVVPSNLLRLPSPVDPGEHRVTAQAPSGPVVEVVVSLSIGAAKEVLLDVDTPASGSGQSLFPLAVSAPPGISTQRAGAYFVGSIGIAALVAGGFLGGIAVAKRDMSHCDHSACDDLGRGVTASARTYAMASAAVMASGLTGLAVAAVLLVTEPRRPPQTAGRRGTRAFAVRPMMEALPVGQAGLTFGLRGAW